MTEIIGDEMIVFLLKFDKKSYLLYRNNVGLDILLYILFILKTNKKHNYFDFPWFSITIWNFLFKFQPLLKVTFDFLLKSSQKQGLRYAL